MVLILLVLLIVVPTANATEKPATPALTLSGSWTGRWVDSREGYAGNGGNFTCIAIDNAQGGWTATFTVGKTLIFKAALQGKLQDEKIVFDSAVSLGKFHGVYSFKGFVTRDAFTGEYAGPDEKGTFKMMREGAAH